MIENVVEHLKTPPVSALNGDRVFPDQTREKLTTSIVVSEISTEPRERNLEGSVALWFSAYQIDIRSNTRANTDAIKAAVISSLDNLSGSINGVPFDRSLLENGRNDFETDAGRYLSSLTFFITHN